MIYSYKIQVGNSPCSLSFTAENKDSKPSSRMSGSGSTEGLKMLNLIMAESSSVSEFESRVASHGGTSWIDVPSSDSSSSSSGMSWGSSSESDDDE